MKPVKGMYYTQYEDETWEQALECHTQGFKTIEDAIAESVAIGSSVPYVVKDSEGNIVKEDSSS